MFYGIFEQEMSVSIAMMDLISSQCCLSSRLQSMRKPIWYTSQLMCIFITKYLNDVFKYHHVLK